MPKTTDKLWTRRKALAGLAGLCAPSAFAASPDGTHFVHADLVRRRVTPQTKPLRLLIPQGSRANVAVVAEMFTNLTGVSFEFSEASVREIATSLLVKKLQGQIAYDIALPPTYEIPDLVAANAIAPLNAYDTKRQANTEMPRGLYTNGDEFDGLRYGYQTDGDVFLMFLNQSLLSDGALSDRYADRHGLPFVPPTSWEEFDQQVRFVHQTMDRPGAVLFRGHGQVEWEFWLRLHAKGVWPLSPDFEPQIDTDFGTAVLEEMIGISPHIHAGVESGRSFLPGWRHFADTGAYATFGWGGTQKLFRNPSFDVADALTVASMPGGQGPRTPSSLPYFNWGWSYTVTQGARDPELALAFIHFAVSPEASTKAVREANGFFDPFRQEHYRDQTIQQIYGDDFLSQHQTSLGSAIPDFYVANRNAYFETLGSWLTLALDGTVAPDQALKNASDHWRLLSDETGHQKQARRWRQLRAKYPPDIAAHLRDLSI